MVGVFSVTVSSLKWPFHHVYISSSHLIVRSKISQLLQLVAIIINLSGWRRDGLSLFPFFFIDNKQNLLVLVCVCMLLVIGLRTASKVGVSLKFQQLTLSSHIHIYPFSHTNTCAIFLSLTFTYIHQGASISTSLMDTTSGLLFSHLIFSSYFVLFLVCFMCCFFWIFFVSVLKCVGVVYCSL